MRSILLGFIVGVSLYGLIKPHTIDADQIRTDSIILEEIEGLTKCGKDRSSYGVAKTIKMIATAYSSTPDQTDDTPFVTASGKEVEEGIVANNLLPFGTRIRIPDVYGDKVFVVEDRMHKRKGKYMVDIWMSETQLAKNFGAKLVSIEVLES